MEAEEADPEELRQKYDDIQKRSLDMFGSAYKKKVDFPWSRNSKLILLQ